MNLPVPLYYIRLFKKTSFNVQGGTPTLGATLPAIYCGHSNDETQLCTAVILLVQPAGLIPYPCGRGNSAISDA
jgi:hypothetical protein